MPGPAWSSIHPALQSHDQKAARQRGLWYKGTKSCISFCTRKHVPRKRHCIFSLTIPFPAHFYVTSHRVGKWLPPKLVTDSEKYPLGLEENCNSIVLYATISIALLLFMTVNRKLLPQNLLFPVLLPARPQCFLIFFVNPLKLQASCPTLLDHNTICQDVYD